MFGESKEITITLPKDFVEALDIIAEDSYLPTSHLLLSELDNTELFKMARALMLSRQTRT